MVGTTPAVFRQPEFHIWRIRGIRSQLLFQPAFQSHRQRRIQFRLGRPKRKAAKGVQDESLRIEFRSCGRYRSCYGLQQFVGLKGVQAASAASVPPSPDMRMKSRLDM